MLESVIFENISTLKGRLLEKQTVEFVQDRRNQCVSLKKSEPNFSIQKQPNTGFALAVMKKSQAFQKSLLYQSRQGLQDRALSKKRASWQMQFIRLLEVQSIDLLIALGKSGTKTCSCDRLSASRSFISNSWQKIIGVKLSKMLFPQASATHQPQSPLSFGLRSQGRTKELRFKKCLHLKSRRKSKSKRITLLHICETICMYIVD